MILRPAFVGLLFISSSMSMSVAFEASSGGDVEAVVRDLLDKGETSQATETIKAELEKRPESKPLHRLLVEAYLADGNESWALRTLYALRDLDPEDCEPSLVIAWLSLNQGDPDEAESILLETRCEDGSALDARRSLFLAEVHGVRGDDDESKAHLERARSSAAMFLEDRVRLRRIVKTSDPSYVEPLFFRLDWIGGWTSNGFAGSPTDSATSSNDARSAFSRLETSARFLAPATGDAARFGVQGDAKLSGLAAEEVREQSSVSLGARPSALMGGGDLALELAYGFDAMSILGGDRYDSSPVWFYNSHRAEAELRLPAGILVFGGGGLRTFREMGRTRTELDGGIGGHVSFDRSFRLIGALTTRGHDARNDAYDLRGLTALLSQEILFKKSWSMRLGALFGADFYPLSAGYFDEAYPDTKRRDLLLKLSLSAYTPPLRGLKAGVTYEFADRWSTTEAYSYVDHRVSLRLIYQLAADPWLPRRDKKTAHMPIAYEGEGAELEERIQDLLRQEEAAQKSSSCVE